jgi:hypothetical protein
VAATSIPNPVTQQQMQAPPWEGEREWEWERGNCSIRSFEFG